MTDTGPTIGLVLDCQDPAPLANFWAAALDYVSPIEFERQAPPPPTGEPSGTETVA